MTDRRLAAADRAPAPRTLVDIVLATAAAHPDAPAVDDTSTVLTYGDLTAAARRLATQLHRVGVRRGGTVGVRAPSGYADLYVAILGILFAGASYVPSTPTTPRSGPTSSSARPGWRRSSAPAVRSRSPRAAPPAPTARATRCPRSPPTTTPG